MFQRVTIPIFAMLLVAGCAQSPDIMSAPDKCPDANPGFITIVINYKSKAGIIVPQDPQIVVPGDVIQFILRGEDNVLVSTSGKDSAAGWLNGSGKKNSRRPETARFLVCVPRDLFDNESPEVTEKRYAYNVDAVRGNEEWPRLDPIVIVDRM
jgi:hypothetical protein